MKKLVLVAAAIFALSFASCNMCSNETANQNDSIVGAADTTMVVDSVAADSVVADSVVAPAE